MQGLVDVQMGEGFVEIAIRSDILFTSGAAQPGRRGAAVQSACSARPCAAFPNSIRVEGHTDNVPMNGGAFTSNWELSAARAASVVHMLIESGVDARRLSVVAYGEFRPVLPNATPDGRNANRRVVLIIEGSEPTAETALVAAPAPATVATPATAPLATP